jgi:hypothetical protein
MRIQESYVPSSITAMRVSAQRARRLHTCIHAAVENQLAAKDDPVNRAMDDHRRLDPKRFKEIPILSVCKFLTY